MTGFDRSLEAADAIRARVARRLRDLRTHVDGEMGQMLADLNALERIEAERKSQCEPEAHGGAPAGGLCG
jgi:hypothetical protein